MVYRRFYFASLSVLALVCTLFAVPTVQAWVLELAQGSGLALLLTLPTLFVLLLCGLPATLCRDRPQLRLPLVGFGVAVGFVVLAFPGYLTDVALRRDLANRHDVSAAPLARDGPIGIEIHRSIGTTSGPYDIDLHGPNPCTALCERLLLGGDTAWVRMLLRNDYTGAETVQTVVLLEARRGAPCQSVNPDFQTNATCVVFAADHGYRADLTIRIDEAPLNQRAQKKRLYQPVGIRRATATAGTDDVQVFQRTRIFHRRPTVWLAFDVTRNINGDAHRGVGLLRGAAASAPLDLATQVAALGIGVGPRLNPDRVAQDAAYVASLVANGPQQAPEFSRALGRLVDGWHAELYQRETISKSMEAIFCATKDDTRLPGGYWKSAVITAHDIACGYVAERANGVGPQPDG